MFARLNWPSSCFCFRRPELEGEQSMRRAGKRSSSSSYRFGSTNLSVLADSDFSSLTSYEESSGNIELAGSGRASAASNAKANNSHRQAEPVASTKSENGKALTPESDARPEIDD